MLMAPTPFEATMDNGLPDTVATICKIWKPVNLKWINFASKYLSHVIPDVFINGAPSPPSNSNCIYLPHEWNIGSL